LDASAAAGITAADCQGDGVSRWHSSS
jgi:hypothetical protein